MKKESEKVGLKLNIQKSKIMASSPNTSWQIDGETVADFFFLGSKINKCPSSQGYGFGHQSWVFIGGTDVEAETPILWPPDAEI